MSDYLDNLVKVTGNEYATKVSDGVEAGDVTGHVDTCLLYTSPSPRD